MLRTTLLHPEILDVLETLVSALPVETAIVMVPAEGPTPEIQRAFKKLLPEGVPMKSVRARVREYSSRDRCCATRIEEGDLS
jgi:hypothetical protein